MDTNELTSRRPYLFKAFYNWIIDNKLTPYIIVNSAVNGVMIPSGFVENNQILEKPHATFLNISPLSVSQFSVTNEQIEFYIQFEREIHHIIIPMSALEVIYAHENGVGFGFETEKQNLFHIVN